MPMLIERTQNNLRQIELKNHYKRAERRAQAQESILNSLDKDRKQPLWKLKKYQNVDAKIPNQALNIIEYYDTQDGEVKNMTSR